MILEIVTWNIKTNYEEEFEKAFAEAKKYLIESNGYKSHQFNRCIEVSNKFSLLVYWETIEDHTIGFQKSDNYQKYRALIHPYTDDGTTLEHYQEVAF